ncbi:unnamed protein product, partial [Ectocarpus sp. 6 AP-2014]
SSSRSTTQCVKVSEGSGVFRICLSPPRFVLSCVSVTYAVGTSDKISHLQQDLYNTRDGAHRNDSASVGVLGDGVCARGSVSGLIQFIAFFCALRPQNCFRANAKFPTFKIVGPPLTVESVELSA